MQTEMASRLLHSDIDREKELARSLSKNIDHLRQQKHLNDRLKQLRKHTVSPAERHEIAACWLGNHCCHWKMASLYMTEGHGYPSLAIPKPKHMWFIHTNDVESGLKLESIISSELQKYFSIPAFVNLSTLSEECSNDLTGVAGRSYGGHSGAVPPKFCCVQKTLF